MKVVVIGCTHAGTAAIKNLRALNPDAEVTVFERNDNISFLSCGIALYVGGVVSDPKGLFYSSPEELKSLGVNTKMKHDVKNVDIKGKKLTVENLETGEVFDETFDKLIITSGSWPIIPRNIEGIDLENVLLCKNYNHANEIIERSKSVKRVVVVGAGYIGVELVEAFRDNGKEVILVDAEDRILSKYFDKEFTDVAEESFREKGIVLATGEKVVKIEGVNGKVSKIVTDKNDIKKNLIDQVSGSVHLEQSIRKMIEWGVDTFVEIGPGKTMAGFVKKIDSQVRMFNIEEYEDVEKVCSQVLEAK